MDERIGNLLVGEAELANLARVIESQRLFRYHPSRVPGPSFADLLERDAAELIGSPRATALSSATSGLQIALIAVGVCPGDQVLVPAYSFIGTATCVLNVGAIPMFVDIDDTYGMCPRDLERKLTPEVKAVVVAHLQGAAADVEAIRDLCRARGVPLVEDCAQAFGVKVGGRAVGTFGDVGVFSLQANKIVVAGEGGVVVARDAEIHDRVRRLHDQGCERAATGLPRWPVGSTFGFNYKIDELTAAVAHAQIRRFEEIKSRMARRASIICDAVAGLPVTQRGCRDTSGTVRVSVAFTSQLPAEALSTRLRGAGVPAQRLYARPLYQQPVFAELNSPYRNRFPFNQLKANPYVHMRCEMAEHVSEHSVWIMLNPLLTEEECRAFGDGMRAAFRESHPMPPWTMAPASR